jgi:ribosome modulation factor
MKEGSQLSQGVLSEGVDSYLREWPREKCPYPPGSNERKSWLEGWNQTAHADRHSYSRLSLNERR